MTKHDPEMLSMLIDGECDADKGAAILREIGQTGDGLTQWHGYHLIGDALRKSLPDRIDTSFSSRVSMALESEPAYLLPGHFSSHSSVTREQHKPTSQPKKTVAREHARFRFGAAAGFAMAASLSAVAVFNLGQTDSPVSIAPIVTAKVEQPIAESNAAPGNLTRSNRPSLALASTGSAPSSVARPMLTSMGGASTLSQFDDGSSMSYPTEAADLYDYLVNYGRYSAGVGQSDMLAHISLATYTSPR